MLLSRNELEVGRPIWSLPWVKCKFALIEFAAGLLPGISTSQLSPCRTRCTNCPGDTSI
jgi:hypothetical protein